MGGIGQPGVSGHFEGETRKEKIEVITRNAGRDLPIVEVRSLRWGSGIGWYSQKTLTLTPGQARRLAQLLWRSSSPRLPRSKRGKVVPFRRHAR